MCTPTHTLNHTHRTWRVTVCLPDTKIKAYHFTPMFSSLSPFPISFFFHSTPPSSSFFSLTSILPFTFFSPYLRASIFCIAPVFLPLSIHNPFLFPPPRRLSSPLVSDSPSPFLLSHSRLSIANPLLCPVFMYQPFKSPFFVSSTQPRRLPGTRQHL